MQYKIIPTTIILKIFKKMEFERLAIQDLVLLKPKIFSDDRGHFFESYNQKEIDKIVGSKINFVQDNCSLSKRGVFRGIHLQRYPYSQGKLVRVAQGKVIDFAIDLRKDSKTYLMWEKVELSDENSHMLWIPEGFGHAFLTISEFAIFCYKATNFYNRDSEECIIWNDPKIGLEIPDNDLEILVSKKDSNGKFI